jgi:hypothetical protein
MGLSGCNCLFPFMADGGVDKCENVISEGYNKQNSRIFRSERFLWREDAGNRDRKYGTVSRSDHKKKTPDCV